MAITCKIQDVPSGIKWDWQIQQKSYQRTTLSLNTCENVLNIQVGQKVELFDNEAKIFSGIIKKKNTFGEYKLECNLEVHDNNSKADKRRVNAVVTNMTVATAITTYLIPILNQEGVTLGTIDCPITIVREVWRFYKVSECLDRMKALQPEYIWFIDIDSRLHFRPKSQLPTITIDNTFRFTNFQYSQDMENYFNSLYVLGTSVRTSLQTFELLTPLADGNTRTFVCRFPLSQAPTRLEWYNGSIWQDIALTDIGINGIDTGKKWYWSYNSNSITQDTSETVLAVGQAVRLHYYGLRPLVMKNENLAEITNRQLLEGGSGIYDQLQEISGLDDLSQATQYVASVLGQYSELCDQISFTTLSPIDIYSNIVFNLPYYGISNMKMLVDSITITQTVNEGREKVKYSVKTIDSATFGGWESYFYDIIKNQRKYTLNEADILLEIKGINESVGIDSNIWFNAYSGSPLPQTLPFILGGENDEVIINE
ncbi:MAG: hypothetical protein ACRCW9_03855 [Cetobacterium sp.]